MSANFLIPFLPLLPDTPDTPDTGPPYPFSPLALYLFSLWPFLRQRVQDRKKESKGWEAPVSSVSPVSPVELQAEP